MQSRAIVLSMSFFLIAALVAARGLAQEPSSGDDFAGLSVVPHRELSRMRGREGDVTTTVSAQQSLQANSSGNTIIIEAGSVNGGSIMIKDSSLENFRGVGNFALNTGNGATIQAAINLVIMLQ